MSFTSGPFALLLATTLIAYHVLRSLRAQNLVLLAAGLAFYSAWDYRFLVLLLYSASVDYIGGLGIAGERPTKSNIVLLTVVGVLATAALTAPIDWRALATLVLPPTAFAGGWVEPAPWRGPFVAGGDWSHYWAALAGFGLLGLSTWVGYRRPEASRAKYFLVVSLVANLGLLGFFKYFDFFVAGASALVASLGLGAHDWALGIIVPAGISFYTFQAMSYSIDVYRGLLKPTHRFAEYLLFVSYFPHLVAGPIQQANWLLPQVQRPRVMSAAAVQAGMFMLGWGLFKKLFVADNLAPLVDQAFAPGAHPSGPQILLSTYAFALQIYADFSAYTDIARGISRFFGIELSLNFNVPYAATNPREFWQRWHISLSSWLRDYLYIPLGGNRGTALRVQSNLMITMVLGGLWHGARLNFVFWGAYQGFLLVAHRWIEPVWGRWYETLTGTRRAIADAATWGVFFHLVCFGWLLFRADSGGQIAALSLGVLGGWSDVTSVVGGVARLVFYGWPLVAMDVMQRRSGNLLVALTWPWPVRAVAYVVFFYLALLRGVFDSEQFIYFQF